MKDGWQKQSAHTMRASTGRLCRGVRKPRSTGAAYFGIGRRTFYSMMQRDEEIAARYKRGKAKAIGVIAQGLINKARSGDTTSMIFFLKTQAGWRETT
jgi:hypothetical protein